MPCNCDDPIILQFADKSLDFFWLHEIAITDLPVTLPRKKKNWSKGVAESDYQKDGRYPLFSHESK